MEKRSKFENKKKKKKRRKKGGLDIHLEVAPRADHRDQALKINKKHQAEENTFLQNE